MAVASKCILGVEDSQSFNELGIDLCRYRSDEQLFIRQQKDLAKYFMNAPGPVVDLGCGRVTTLELLKSSGVTKYAIDTLSPAAQVCRKKVLRITESDLLPHLAELNDSSMGVICC